MDIDFLGPMLSDDVATAIAVGDMDPISMLVFSTDGRSPSQPPRQGFAAPPPRQQPQLLDPRMFSRYAASNGSAPGKPNSTSTSRASPPWKRKFPRSFGAQPRTGLLGAFKSSGSTPAPSNVAASTSSPTISRFFTSDPKKMSPPNELVKKSSSSSLVSSEMDTFESQDPVDINVSKSISFEPSEKKTIGTAVSVPLTTKKEKENSTPPSAKSQGPVKRAVPEAPVIKENAFARMMRAGARQQKPSGVKRGGLGALSGRHPVIKKPRTISFHAPSARTSDAKMTPSIEPEAEAGLDQLSAQKDSQRDDGDSLSEESAGESAGPAIKAKQAPTGNWLDRFRFKA
jgi:hypothetical protein